MENHITYEKGPTASSPTGAASATTKDALSSPSATIWIWATHGKIPTLPRCGGGIKVQSYNGEYAPPPFEKLNRLIEAGPFEVHVARTFNLDQAADAQRALEDHYLGKLALITQ
jgi:NADPH:quinone reductase-like Zn-dependent oxidoreductase